jgi:hypothetical protein
MKGIPYRELGKLLHLAVATRPDISYAVGVLCRFVEYPGKAHWEAARRVLCYLRGTTSLSLVYSSSPFLVHHFANFSDAELGRQSGQLSFNRWPCHLYGRWYCSIGELSLSSGVVV